MLVALLLTGAFMVAEAIGGALSGSLALLADAGHMMTDTAALALSWYAFRVARRPADLSRSYGHHRFQVLAAFINGATLIGIAIWITVEAAERLLDPVDVLGGMMLAVAVLGLVVNIIAFAVLHGGSRENLNVRGAVLHVAGDMMGSAAAIVAAGVILLTGWTAIDPILSVLVALLILRSAWALVSRSWHVLMEGTPEGIDVKALTESLVREVPGVLDIHHVHLWSLTPQRPLMTLHATLSKDGDHEAALSGIRDGLARRGLNHATIQVERGPCPEAAKGSRESEG